MERAVAVVEVHPASHSAHPCIAVATALCVALSYLVTCCRASDDEPRAAPDGARRAPVCTARLEIEKTTVAIGDKLEFNVTVHNRSNAPVTLLNPFLAIGVPVNTADLVVIDEDGTAVGAILSLGTGSGSYQALNKGDFFTLPPRGIVGTRDSAKLSIIRRQNEQIRRGKYRVQMIFRDWFVSAYPYSGLPLCPWDPAARNDPQYIERTKRWKEDHSGKELFRSNAVEIEVVPANQKAESQK